MASKEFIILALYLLVSGFVLFFFYVISKKISGPNLTQRKFWLFFILLVVWGASQLSLARYGYFLLYPPSQDVFANDYIIRWAAFVSVLLQVFLIPKKESSKYV